MRIQYACVVGFIVGIATQGVAQVPETSLTSAPSGVVTGYVLCEDTRRPGRFADVMLLRKPDKVMHPIAPPIPTDQSKPVVLPAPQVVSVSTRSRLDGSYEIRHVPPGDYFVIAKMYGYILPVVPLAGDIDVGRCGWQYGEGAGRRSSCARGSRADSTG
jgi:hypothetical protein